MNTQSSVPIEKLADKMNLTYRTPEVNLKGKALTTTQVNRPALQLTGYFDYFDADRLQVIGYVEYTYLETLPRERKIEMYRRLLSSGIPALVYTTRTMPDEDMLELANQLRIPVFTTDR
ncbi:MAG: HPr(Ser) kinase/phosphatase, partial [Lachnospiraceae bacterium]|nr:HPr(Ser) kinase/phosphatase [Lachnospiraceae bacterium]